MRFTRWDEQLTTEATNGSLSELALWHTSLVHNETARIFLERSIALGDYRALCDYVPDYTLLSVSDAINIRQALAFFQKRDDLDLGIDKEKVAYHKYLDAECLCQQTNNIFRAWSRGRFQFRPRVEAVFHRSIRQIATILGDVPNLEDLDIRFGPGGTTQVKAQIASAQTKLSQMHCCSEDLIDLAEACVNEMPGWLPIEDRRVLEEGGSVQVPVSIAAGNLSFVPKNAKTHRSVVVEPSLNMMFQLGIGDYIAARLKRFGIDISDQRFNQNAARLGSISGDLATLDLSSASDTIARELVAHLLPVDWFLLLDQLRTSSVLYKGSTMQIQKFSSMGNGFTFPLETLIFYALAVSTVMAQDEHKVLAYGDDLIVPTYAVESLTEVLDAAGFVVNSDKSFSTGPFRESCGADYLSGIDIRPVYQKTGLSGFDAFRLHNFYVRELQPEPAAIVLSWISEPLRIWGPDGFGDGHLLGDGLVPHKKRNTHGYGGYTFETYTFKPRKRFRVLPGDYVYPLYSIYRADPQPTAGFSSLRVGGINPYFKDDSLVLRTTSLLAHKYLTRVEMLESKCSLGFTNHDKRGRPEVVFHGVKGYKRISIYTLSD